MAEQKPRGDLRRRRLIEAAAGLMEADAMLGARRRHILWSHYVAREGKTGQRESVGRLAGIMNLLSPRCLLSRPVYQ